MNSRVHNSALDGVRGLAIVLVLFEHGVQFFRPSALNAPFLKVMDVGWTGVDLFFVLSGFLITGILMDTVDADNRAGSFYARRVLRIFPIYYFTLLAVLALRVFSGVRAWTPLHGWLDYVSYFLYFQNWLPLIHYGVFPPSALGHFWSLGVEEQFYFVWPFLVWKLRSPQKVLRASLAVAATMLLLRIILMCTVGTSIWYLTLPITRGEGLLAGAALAAWMKLGKPMRPSIVAVAFVLGVTGFAWVAMTNRGLGPWLLTIGITLIVVAWTAMLSTAAIEAPFLTRLWSSRPLTTLGRYSYGIYVYHVPVFLFSGSVIAHLAPIRPPFRTGHAVIYFAFLVCVSICVALISYHFIEQPFLRLKSRFEAKRTPSRIAAAHMVADPPLAIEETLSRR